MKWWLSENECTGCLACENICKSNAITVMPDRDGFLYPVIDNTLCVNCGACKNVCPVEKCKINPNFYQDATRTDVYAAWNNDTEVRLDSTSGGVFTVLAKRTIEEGGLVCGAVFNKELNVENVMIKSLDDLAALRRSKYVASNPGHIYREVKKALDAEKIVLFCGTPCQVAAVKSYVGDSENLLLVDFVCRNINPPLAYRSYLKSIAAHKHADIIEVAFRDKDDSWHNYSTKITFDDGSKKNINRYEDPYMKGFINDNLYMRPSCEECNFRGFNRGSDITLGDYWGVRDEWDDKKGTSLVIVHTEKGREVLEAVSNDLTMHKSNVTEAVNKNKAIVESVKRNKRSEEFMDRLYKGDDFIVTLDEFEHLASEDKKAAKKVSVYIFGKDKEKRNITKESLAKVRDVTVEIIEKLDNPDDMDEFLEKSTGSLISFLEEGDVVHFDMYEQAFKNMEAGADVSLFGVKEVIGDKATWPNKNAFTGEGNVLFLYDSLVRHIGKESDYTSYGDVFCNKVYKKSVFKGVKLGRFNSGYKELCMLKALLTAKSNIKKVIGSTVSRVDRAVKPYRIGSVDVEEYTNLVFSIAELADKLNEPIFREALLYLYKYEKEVAKQMEYRGFADVKKKLHMHMGVFYPEILGAEVLIDTNLTELEEYYMDKINTKIETDQILWDYKDKYNRLKKKYDALTNKKSVKFLMKINDVFKKFKGILGVSGKKEDK